MCLFCFCCFVFVSSPLFSPSVLCSLGFSLCSFAWLFTRVWWWWWYRERGTRTSGILIKHKNIKYKNESFLFGKMRTVVVPLCVRVNAHLMKMPPTDFVVNWRYRRYRLLNTRAVINWIIATEEHTQNTHLFTTQFIPSYDEGKRSNVRCSCARVILTQSTPFSSSYVF